MSSAMPVVDLALSLEATRGQAQERSQERGDVYDDLAEAARELRALLTGENRTGGEASDEIRRDVVPDDTAEQLRADLTTLSHDRSPERTMEMTRRLRDVHRAISDRSRL